LCRGGEKGVDFTSLLGPEFPILAVLKEGEGKGDSRSWGGTRRASPTSFSRKKKEKKGKDTIKNGYSKEKRDRDQIRYITLIAAKRGTARKFSGGGGKELSCRLWGGRGKRRRTNEFFFVRLKRSIRKEKEENKARWIRREGKSHGKKILRVKWLGRVFHLFKKGEGEGKRWWKFRMGEKRGF